MVPAPPQQATTGVRKSRLPPLLPLIEKKLPASDDGKPPPLVAGPVHNLIDTPRKGATDTTQTPRPVLILNPKLRYDFLSRRYRAFCEADPNLVAKEDDHYWSGATAWERSLAACCFTQSKDGEDDDNIPGALAQPNILRFVGLIAVHCQDLASKALALAILERTHAADDEDGKEWALETARLERLARGETNDTKGLDGDDGSPPKRRRLTLSGNESELESESSSEDWDDSAEATSWSDTSHNDRTTGAAGAPAVVALHSMSPSVVTPQRIQPPSRLALFLKAGGLPILSRWLMECSQAPPVSTSAPGTMKALSASDALLASTTGALLLPLLLFLQKVPFDLKAIKQSKINKKISALSKALDSMTLAQPPAGLSTPPGKRDAASPRTGSTVRATASGLPIGKIKAAVEQLKKIWGERAKEAKETETDSTATDKLESPFASLLASLEDRLNTLNKYEDTEGSGEALEHKPAWLAELLNQRQKSASRHVSKKPISQTTAEKARRERERERENERISKTKEDLAKTMLERTKLLEKMRAMQQQNVEAEASAAAQRKNASMSHRGVRWKDNLGSMATSRQRDVLEEVYIFNKNDPAHLEPEKPTGTSNGQAILL